MGIKPSGKNNIDALLKDKYWNGPGKGVSLTYSIDSTGSDGLDSSERAMVAEALKRWSQVANISFTKVSKGGNLRFAGQSGTGGVASYKTKKNILGIFSTTDQLSHVNIKLGKASRTGRGNRFLEVALHEIGHALGLKHPGNYNGRTGGGESPFLPYSQDNSTNTIMTYNDVGAYAATPMAYDIRAAQYLYGAKVFNSGDTHYKFDTVFGHTNGYYSYRGSSNVNKPMKLSIWDSAGYDTVDFSRLAARGTGYYFNINEGGMLTTRDAYNAGSYQPRNNKANTSGLRYKTTTYGTSIAYGAKIEKVVGSSSNDTIIGNNWANALIGGRGNDSIYGRGGNDYLYGSAGNDYLNGGTGRDRMYGGTGNDRYIVDNSGDQITEYRGQGTDTVYSSISYTLGSNLENLTLQGKAYRGYGNSLNNTIRGNNYVNYLWGSSGNDSLYGYGSNDTLSGGSGNDYLNGGTGRDRMYGGTGNDRYIVDNSGDQITEYRGQGTDTVYSSVSYTLGNNLEHLTLWGSAYRGYGNSLNNVIRGNNRANYLWGSSGNDYIYGNGGNDVLLGGADNDYLNGGTGNDTLVGSIGNDVLVGSTGSDKLTGGIGADKFVFSAVSEGIDRITDFVALQGDKLQIKASSFGGGLIQGLLDSSQFVLGSSATDANDRFIYNQSTGALSFDIDGAGATGAVQFAKFTNNAALTHNNFTLV